MFFPSNIKKAILNAFYECEDKILKILKPSNCIFSCNYDSSGSCASVVIIANDQCYVANLGNSKVLVSEDTSQKIYNLFLGHDANNNKEKKRIEEFGGYIYR